MMRFKQSNLAWYLRLLKGNSGVYALVLLAYSLTGVSGIVFAFIARNIIDAAVSADMLHIRIQLIFLGLLMVMTFGLTVFANNQREKIRLKLVMKQQEHLAETLASRKYTAVDALSSGEWNTLFFSDTQTIADTLVSVPPSFLQMAFKILASIIALSFFSVIYVIVLAAAGILFVVLSSSLRRRVLAIHLEAKTLEAGNRTFSQEIITHLIPIKIFHGIQAIIHKLHTVQNPLYRINLKRNRISILASSGLGFISQMTYLIALGWASILLATSSISYGSLMAIVQLTAQLQAPFSSASGLLPQVFLMQASAQRIMDFEQLDEENPSAPLENFSTVEAIHFEAVNFAYHREQVLENFTAVIPIHQLTAITGASGIGKSTIFKLMLGLYEPQSGIISIEYTDGSRTILGTGARRFMSYVPQSYLLFAGTILENITFMNPDISLDQVIESAKLACIHEFILQLPDQYSTRIDEQLKGISSGQAQRISIARMLLMNTPIILLDEATSALDAQTEGQLLYNLKQLPDKTIVIVSHNPTIETWSDHTIHLERKHSDEH